MICSVISNCLWQTQKKLVDEINDQDPSCGSICPHTGNQSDKNILFCTQYSQDDIQKEHIQDFIHTYPKFHHAKTARNNYVTDTSL